jgi:hypothetical protein
MRLRLRPNTREQALNLWSFVGTVLTVITAWIGLGFALDGNRAARSPAYHILINAVPGGMRTVGVVLLVLALGMAYAVLTKFDRHSTWVLRVFAGVAFLVGLSQAGSWFVTGELVWAGPFLWVGQGALAEGMVIFPPDALPIKEDTPDAVEPDRSGRGGNGECL